MIFICGKTLAENSLICTLTEIAVGAITYILILLIIRDEFVIKMALQLKGKIKKIIIF